MSEWKVVRQPASCLKFHRHGAARIDTSEQCAGLYLRQHVVQSTIIGRRHAPHPVGMNLNELVDNRGGVGGM